MKALVKYFLILVLVPCAKAQNDIPIGTWRSHFNYQQARLVEKVEDRIYCAASASIFYYDLGDNSLNIVSKIDGLSDVVVTAMAYDETSKVLALGYENGNIDLLHDNEVTNVVQIKNADIDGSKTINHISFNDEKIYFSTNFGVIVVDLETGEVVEAFQNLGGQGEVVSVSASIFDGNKIYLATDVGVLEGVIAAQKNLQDFNNWNRFEGSLIEGMDVTSIGVWDGKILTTDGSSLFFLEEGSWANLGFDNLGRDILKLRNDDGEVLIIMEDNILGLDASGQTQELLSNNSALPKDVILSSDGGWWYADFTKGLTKEQGGGSEHFVPNGIFSGTAVKLQLADGNIAAFAKSISDSYNPINNSLGYSIFKNGAWSTVDQGDLFGASDISAISRDGNFLSSFGDGIINLVDQAVYNENNSPLQPAENSNDVLVSGLAVDSNDNLWVANASSTPLLKRNAEGGWESFSFGLRVTERSQDIKINSLGQVWMILSNSLVGGLLVYNPESKESRYIRSADGLPSSKVTDIEFGKDEEIWIGTENGLAFFPFSFGIAADNSIEAVQPVFENRILFDEELISAIEIDGGNRKWIGTNNGLWLFEDNVDKLLVNFNEENSPLLSNQILDLKIHPTSGELFIATDKGLQSFRTDATEGASTHSNVKIFPNPVTPGYNGQVGISGLASDVNVKITNVSGRLIKELFAAGGSTAWDLADHNGIRAQSGVYLVFSATSDGKETFVGKIAIIN